MSMTSHSNTLLSTRPQLIPGMSLSFCICFSCRDNRPAAADDEDILLCVYNGGCEVWICTGLWFVVEVKSREEEVEERGRLKLMYSAV